MKSSIKNLLSLTFILIFVTANKVTGFTCYCSTADSSCVNEECQANPPFGGCNIIWQAGNTNKVVASCINTVFHPGLCPGSIEHTEGSSVPFRLCCRDNLCNSMENFEEKLIENNYPIPWEVVTTTSDIATSSSIPSQSNSSTILSTTNLVATLLPTTKLVATLLPSTVAVTTATSIASTTTTLSLHTTTSSTTRLEPSLTTVTGTSTGSPPSYAIGIIVVLTVLLVAFILVIFIVVFLHFYPRHIIGAMSVESDGTPTCTLSTEGGDLDDSHFKEGFEGTTSGSGSGLPILIQRSVAAQVTLKEIIGKGRFGEVRRGLYKGDAVAVKIFHTKEEASWNHEVDIYQTCLIRHPNILRFIAADNKDIGMSTQLWLITEYCDNGSLYDVLQHVTLTEDTVLKLCSTAASGLAHLHSDIIGTEGKPAIAHRDIKTRNILVKPDFTCCLADLGLALRYYRDTDKVEEPPTKRVGTRRYLSPEILNDSMNMSNFDCFKRSDMYSFGLVMWETARRGICLDTYEEYQLPYFDLVNPDPTFEDMMKVVAVEKKRPTIPNRWSQSEVFNSLSQLMEQCWHHDGEARVTALRVKKNLSSLQTMKCNSKKDQSVTVAGQNVNNRTSQY